MDNLANKAGSPFEGSWPAEELPREEALVRLYELIDKFNGYRTLCPVNYALNGGTESYEPHAYAYGCCAIAAVAPAR